MIENLSELIKPQVVQLVLLLPLVSHLAYDMVESKHFLGQILDCVKIYQKLL